MTDTDTDTNVDELEAQVEEQQQMIEELCTKLVELSQLLPEHDRRQFLKAGAGAGALLASGLMGRASAQAGDGDTTWGSDTDRDDVYRDLVDAELVRTVSLNGGGPISDGDGIERQIWVIANGASDPSGADPEDIIFEEES